MQKFGPDFPPEVENRDAPDPLLRAAAEASVNLALSKPLFHLI